MVWKWVDVRETLKWHFSWFLSFQHSANIDLFLNVIYRRRKANKLLRKWCLCSNFASILIVKESSKRKSSFSTLHEDDDFNYQHILPLLIQVEKIIMTIHVSMIIVRFKMKCQGILWERVSVSVDVVYENLPRKQNIL